MVSWHVYPLKRELATKRKRRPFMSGVTTSVRSVSHKKCDLGHVSGDWLSIEGVVWSLVAVRNPLVTAHGVAPAQKAAVFRLYTGKRGAATPLEAILEGF